MRYLLFCMACLPAVSMAQKIPDNFSQEKFEIRFHAADKNKDGKLSREEAYAGFPRGPEFFNEIDANNDNHITLDEVSQALARRVNAAVTASSITGKYVKPSDLGSGPASTGNEADPEDLFSSKVDMHRQEYYESLAEDHSNARMRGISTPDKGPPNLINKSF